MESDITEPIESKKSTAIGCFWIIVFIIGAGWFIKSIWDNYKYGEKDPFWKGTELVQVCKTPYYSSEDCYKLNVTLIDKKTAQIHFPNGGYKYTRDITCYFAAKSFPDEPKYVFCRSQDSDGQQWDFMPAWANYPSIEDLSRSLDKYKK